jgi:hypothetical protein
MITSQDDNNSFEGQIYHRSKDLEWEDYDALVIIVWMYRNFEFVIGPIKLII